MSTIQKAQIRLAYHSKYRTKRKMSKKALKSAFFAGADFVALSINGQPCQTNGMLCSCRDFAEGATIEIMESDGQFLCSVDYFTYKPSVEAQKNDVPYFMQGHPIELD